MPDACCRIIGILCLLVSSVSSADTLTLVADEWCPYNCAADSENPGVLIEIARYGLQKGGHSLSYSVMPWTRAIQESREGKYSGIVGASKEDAPDFIFPETPLAQASDTFFVKPESNWHFNNLESLEKVSLGVIQNYAYRDDINAYIEKYSKQPTRVQRTSGEDALEKNIKKLLAGRIDALLEDSYVVEFYLKNHQFKEKIVSAGNLGKDDVFIAFSPNLPKSAEYAELVNAGFLELQSSGKLKEILNRYGQ